MSTITAPPASKVEPACSQRPDLWFSAEQADRALAVHICRSHCPFLAGCPDLVAPVPGTVQAGILHGAAGPVGRQPKPAAAHCADCGGKRAADAVKPTSDWDDCGEYKTYRRHKHHGETPCEPCAEANRQRNRARRTRRSASTCGTIAGLTGHRDAGEPPCGVCVEGQRAASMRGHMAQCNDPATLAAKVDRIRTLAARGLSDRAIGVEEGMSKRQVLRLRTANGIPAGWMLAEQVAA